MKVILLQDVPKVGRKYDIKEVAGGFGRNFLLPRGLAELATDTVVARYEELRAKQAQERKMRDELLAKSLTDLEGKTITFTEKANEQGHLFAGIHTEEIAKAITEQAHLDVAPEHVVLSKPLKETGEHKVEIAVEDQKATVTVQIDELDS